MYECNLPSKGSAIAINGHVIEHQRSTLQKLSPLPEAPAVNVPEMPVTLILCIFIAEED